LLLPTVVDSVADLTGEEDVSSETEEKREISKAGKSTVRGGGMKKSSAWPAQR
jgi:hypothetical protein